VRAAVRGRAWCYGDDVDTDLIMPGAYLRLSAEDAVKHVMEGVDPEFTRKIRSGDIVVAGRNFGMGSSRELAPQGLVAAGVGAVVAKSFARIFFRNALNLGLPVVECAQAAEIREGDELEVRLEDGVVRDLTTGAAFEVATYSDHILRLLAAGGLVAFLEEEIRSGRLRPAPRPPDPQVQVVR
jgi:3-isopropylmalate/(R)-2-methylmalate dehydratase small subunit